MAKYITPFGKAATLEDQKYYQCLDCGGLAEFRCYTVESCEIVTWLCGDCVLQLRERICKFVREQGLDVDLSDSPRSITK